MLVTKYGAVEEDSDLGSLDQDLFLAWVKQKRATNPVGGILPQTDEEWIITYKRDLAKSYAERYHALSEKLS